MKRQIRYISASIAPSIDTSMFSGTPFRCNAGTSFGNSFLTSEDLKYRQDRYNRTGDVVMMSPEDYFWMCSMYAWDHYVPVSSLKEQRAADDKINEKLKNLILNGTKLDLCYIDKADHRQEGLHRMMVVGDLYGWDTKFPVLVISVYDQEREERAKKREEAYDFRSNTFKDICKSATFKLMDIPVEDAKSYDLIETYRDCIYKACKDWLLDVDIDFEIEIEGDLVKVWLTEYDGFDFDHYLGEPFETELEDLKYKLYEFDSDWNPVADDLEEDYSSEYELPADLSDSVLDIFFKDKPDE